MYKKKKKKNQDRIWYMQWGSQHEGKRAIVPLPTEILGKYREK